MRYLICAAISNALLASGCANVKPPTGGDIDSLAPRLIQTLPLDGQTNYQAPLVVLDFNEDVDASQLKRELLITPYTEIPFETKVRRSRVEVAFEEPFPENTTVTLNFNQGVKDVTEKNPAEDLRLTFSTGPTLDSLRVTGQVVDYLTLQPVAEAVVSLYRPDTTTLRKNKPYYFTRTDEEGHFALEYLREGDYLIYALADANNTLTFDNYREQVAFLPDTVQLTQNQDSLSLRLQPFDYRPPRLTRVRSDTLVSELTFNKGLRSVALNWKDDSTAAVVASPTEGGSVLRVFHTRADSGSYALLIDAIDSTYQTLRDTAEITFGTRPALINTATDPTLLTSVDRQVLADAPLTVTARDSLIFDPGAFAWQVDSTTVLEIDGAEITRLEANRLALELPPDTQVKALLVRSGTVRNVVHQFVPADTFAFSVEEVTGGIVSGTVQTEASSFVVELLNANFSVRDKQRDQTAFEFRNVPKGTYRLRVRVDSDGNGRWDPGDFNARTPAEPVYLLPKPVEVRENWEIRGLEIILAQ